MLLLLFSNSGLTGSVVGLVVMMVGGLLGLGERGDCNSSSSDELSSDAANEPELLARFRIWRKRELLIDVYVGEPRVDAQVGITIGRIC